MPSFQNSSLTAFDINPDKVYQINRQVPPIADPYIENYFLNETLNLQATTDIDEAFSSRSLLIIAIPTNYNPTLNTFDTSPIEQVLDEVEELGSNPVVVIKSTIPVDYTNRINELHPNLGILFS